MKGSILRNRLNNVMRHIFIFSPIILVCLFLGCKQAPEPGIKIDISWLEGGKTSKEQVVKLLGEPPFVCDFGGFDYSWYYPINNSFSRNYIIPATLLNVSFDERGYVREWGFFDSRAQTRLVIRESLAQAEKWQKGVSGEVGKVVINDVIKPGISTKKDVEEGLKYWPSYEPSSGRPTAGIKSCFYSTLTLAKKSKHSDGELWTFYVMRPSPLYVPPIYLVIDFLRENPEIVQSRYFEGYGRQ